MSRRFFLHGGPRWTRSTWERALADSAELESRGLSLSESARLLGTTIGSVCVFRRALEIWAGERG